jgi:hypothetical protein
MEVFGDGDIDYRGVAAHLKSELLQPLLIVELAYRPDTNHAPTRRRSEAVPNLCRAHFQLNHAMKNCRRHTRFCLERRRTVDLFTCFASVPRRGLFLSDFPVRTSVFPTMWK